jgi:hypothetical protein
MPGLSVDPVPAPQFLEEEGSGEKVKATISFFILPFPEEGAGRWAEREAGASPTHYTTLRAGPADCPIE